MALTMELKHILIDNSPAGYVPSAELIHAVEVAYALKRPLLLSGEPGTGKTEFAKWVADILAAKYGFHQEPLVFNTKSTSTAQDLFYYYDAISQFRDANIGRSTNEGDDTKKITRQTAPTQTEDYIDLKALGKAFQHAVGNNSLVTGSAIGLGIQPKGSVVLIDEIDKAPRDFPNDLLNEIEKYEFEIRELGKTITLSEEEKKKIVIIMTSNFEKNLPEAFLRRCIYFHIKFPDETKLEEIVKKRLQVKEPGDMENIRARIAEFYKLRTNENIQKKPSTSEFLDYIRVLHDEKTLGRPLFTGPGKIALESIRYVSLLLKKREDRDLYIVS